jgi:hypothetical protein
LKPAVGAHFIDKYVLKFFHFNVHVYGRKGAMLFIKEISLNIDFVPLN